MDPFPLADQRPRRMGPDTRNKLLNYPSDYAVSRTFYRNMCGGETMKTLCVGIVGAAGQVGSALLKELTIGGEFSAVGICRNRVSSARVEALGLPVRTVDTGNPDALKEATRDV